MLCSLRRACSKYIGFSDTVDPAAQCSNAAAKPSSSSSCMGSSSSTTQPNKQCLLILKRSKRFFGISKKGEFGTLPNNCIQQSMRRVFRLMAKLASMPKDKPRLCLALLSMTATFPGSKTFFLSCRTNYVNFSGRAAASG